MGKRPKLVWSKPEKRKKRQRLMPPKAGKVLIGAAVVGALAGAAPFAFTEGNRETAQGLVKAVVQGRERLPQDGDYWRNCAQARAAGTAPIYSQEPGYREWLDRDGDGIACEPYRGL